MSEEYRIQELLQREVYVGETLVGIITGERSHPRDEFVRSMRLEVVDDVADEYMRKAAECAPLSKELVHSILPNGGVKLSKSMRELQRRWRNTIRIDEQLWAPDELLDRAVMDNNGIDLGQVLGFVKVKRTYRGVIVQTRSVLRRKYELPETLIVPVKQLARTTAFLDELILRCTMKRLLTLPSYLALNDDCDDSNIQ